MIFTRFLLDRTTLHRSDWVIILSNDFKVRFSIFTRNLCQWTSVVLKKKNIDLILTTERFHRLLTTCDTRTQMHASTRKSYSQITRKWLASVAQVLATVNNSKHCSQVTRKSLAGVSQISRKSIYMPIKYIIYFWPLIGCRGDGRHQLLVYVVQFWRPWCISRNLPNPQIISSS